MSTEPTQPAMAAATPRTDAVQFIARAGTFGIGNQEPTPIVSAHFARTLELELAALRAELAANDVERTAILERMKILDETNSELEAELAAKDGALKPFAAIEATHIGNIPDCDAWLWKPSQTSRDLPGINLAHIKAARAALSANAENKGEK